MSNAMSLKAKIKNLAAKKKLPAQIVMQKIDKSVFLAALRATAEHRKTSEQIADINSILQTVSDSEELKSMWEKYRKQFDYAKDISYDDIMNKISELII